MSATYNWRYKSGTVIPAYGDLGIGATTIATSANNVKPSNTVYVALFGNDITGNGSRQYPVKTLSRAAELTTSSGIIVIGAGIYREQLKIASYPYVVADGYVEFDGTGFSTIYPAGFNCSGFYFDIVISNYQTLGNIDMRFERCRFTNVGFQSNNPLNAQNSVFEKISSPFLIIGNHKGNTFIDCYDLRLNDTQSKYTSWNNIYKNCNIWERVQSYISHSLFHSCNLRFNTTAPTAPTAPSTIVPTGYVQINTIDDLRNAHIATFPGASNFNFHACVVTDPLFNNYNIGDYTLSFSSPAKNLSYFGTYVGAKSFAYPIKVSTTESLTGFESSSAINLTIANDSLTLTNTSLDAQIDTKVIVNYLGREIAKFPSYGFNADRNGQYIDSLSDLATVTKSPSDTLNVPASYLVETTAINYNTSTYTAGQRFTTVSGVTSFTTDTNGVLREILEAPQRHTIMARFANEGAVVTVGTPLVSGYYYYVKSGSVTYESVVYNAESVFTAVNTNSFTGSGTVTLALSNEAYQHYESITRPLSNNVGNVRTGLIIRGNGDPDYIRGGINVTEFPINSKFIQVRYYIRVNNLKP